MCDLAWALQVTPGTCQECVSRQAEPMLPLELVMLGGHWELTSPTACIVQWRDNCVEHTALSQAHAALQSTEAFHIACPPTNCCMLCMQGFHSESEDDQSDDEGEHDEGMSGDEEMGEQGDFEGSDGFDEVCCTSVGACLEMDKL